MDLVYAFISSLIMGMVVLSFYKRIVKLSPIKPSYIVSLSFLFAIYRFCCHDYIQEPFRLILGVLIIGIALRFLLKTINWAALILAFTFGHIVWMASAIIASTVAIVLGIETYDLHPKTLVPIYIIGLAVEVITGFIFYKFPKIKNGIQHINDMEIKYCIYSAATIIFTIYGGFRASQFDVAYESRLILAVVLAVLMICIISALIFLIVYFSKKHREKLLTEKKLSEFVQTITDMEQNCLENFKLYQGERAVNHKYKNIIPYISNYCHALMADIKQIKDNSKSVPLADIQERLDALKEFSTCLSDNVLERSVASLIKGLSIPKSWVFLEGYLEQTALECASKEIMFACRNNTAENIWEPYAPLKSEFLLFVVSNILSNAVKELEKTDIIDKQINVMINENNGFLEFEVRDNAHEFSIDVLSKLGIPGNSTNGTGTGYMEIINFMQKNKASLIITENSRKGEFDKSVKVIFDDKNRTIIRSNYRFKLLKKSIKSQKIEVEDGAQHGCTLAY